MTKPHIPFLVFYTLFILSIPFSSDIATSVVPGWHTTIYPPYFIGQLIIVVVLLFVTIGYWQLAKRAHKFNLAIFVIHLILTIPTIIDIKFPFAYLGLQFTNQEEIVNAFTFSTKLVSIAWSLFFVGQLLFLIYYIRTIRGSRIVNNGQKLMNNWLRSILKYFCKRLIGVEFT